jgi:nicotinamide-nucleotide amidase
MQVEVITIGSEVLSGRTLDTNFAFVAGRLEAESIGVVWHTTVGDHAERIGDALRRALERADAVILMGGLGPTPDDLTRKAVSTALGRPLQLDETVLEHIRERVAQLGRRMPAAVETQALVPRGATVLENKHGTAPGLLIMERDKPVFLLPGVPHEMQALAAEFVVPFLRGRATGAVEVVTLRTTGVPESVLAERIGNLPGSWPGSALAYLPSPGGVDLRVTVAGSDAGVVAEVAQAVRRELLERVGEVVFVEGQQGLEEVVGALLLERGYRLAVAESCTGGLLAKRITDVPGSSRYFERGFVCYSNEAKIELLGVSPETLRAHGAVSAPAAEEMARGARERAGVHVAASITGVAGPEGGSDEKPVGTVFVGLASERGEAVRRFRFLGDRRLVRERSAQAALELLRRHLLGLPLEVGW